MTLQELNREYFELYGELYQARGLLSEKQYKLTSDVLLQSYKDDIERCVLKRELETGRERFELRYRVRNWLPRKVLFFWWNATAKRLLKRYVAELKQELRRLDEESERKPAETLPVPKQ